MKKIIFCFLLLSLSLSCMAVDKSKDNKKVDLKKLGSFLNSLYAEIKCPTYPLANLKKLGVTVCIHSLSYDLQKGDILFAYTAYKDNKYLKNFDSVDSKQREKMMLELLGYLSAYTGVTPTFRNTDIYSGKIQTTSMDRIYTLDLLKNNRKIHDFVKDNATVGVRVIEGDVMRYVAFQDLNKKRYYKEGNRVSILDYKGK